jgi:hypothetical protein
MKRDEEKQKNDIDLGNLGSTTLKLSWQNNDFV